VEMAGCDLAPSTLIESRMLTRRRLAIVSRYRMRPALMPTCRYRFRLPVSRLAAIAATDGGAIICRLHIHLYSHKLQLQKQEIKENKGKRYTQRVKMHTNYA